MVLQMLHQQKDKIPSRQKHQDRSGNAKVLDVLDEGFYQFKGQLLLSHHGHRAAGLVTVLTADVQVTVLLKHVLTLRP